ncbi:MAG: serine protein kinase, partial [Planctomycetota bacterium]
RLGRKRARRTLSESHKCDMKLLGWSIIPASCSGVVDKDTQEKIEVVKGRLMRDFGYDEVSATDVLNYVASIFARGDAKGE